MSSTDGPRGNEERGEESTDESVLPPGPRRSTYTPPVPRQPPPPTTDDDELADVIAANLASATGAINVIYQLDDVAPSVPMGAPVEQLAAPEPDARILPADFKRPQVPPAAPAEPEPSTVEPAPAAARPEGVSPAGMPSPDARAVPADLPPPPEFAQPSVPFAAPPRPSAEEEFAAPTSAAPAQPAPAPEPEAQPAAAPSDEPDQVDAVDPEPAVFDLPVIPPSEPFDQAAFLAASAAPSGQRPWIPERQSLRDDELAALLEKGAEHPGGTLGIMEELERQMQLREEESREFAEWQKSMLEVGTPEALAAVNDVMPEFSDLVAASPSSPATQTPSEPSHATAEPAEKPAEPTEKPAEPTPKPAEPTPKPAEPAERRLADAPPPVFTAPPPVIAPPPTAAAPPPLADAPPPVIAPPPLADAPPPTVAAPSLADAPPPTLPATPSSSTAPPPGFDAPPPLVEPPGLPDAWDIPAGHAIPDSEDDPAARQPVIGPQPLIEPAPFGDPFVDRAFTGSVPVVTGSVPIAPHELDVDGDDAVDPTDQVPASFDDLLGPNPGTAPVEPILSPRIPDDEVVLGEAQQLERPRVFSLEQAGLEPTPEEQRVGRAARMFWMWFAANSSIVSIAFGAVLFSLGLSLRQAIVGILAGVAISFLPLGLGTLAGKRSGMPTMVVSRAAFGVVGNSIPALVAFLSRVFWGAAMLWLLGTGVSEILVGAELTGGLDSGLLTVIVLAAGFVIALIVALFGYGMLASFQLVVSVVSGILVVGVIALTYSYVDIAAALTNPDGSWLLAGTVAVLVFSFIGLLWANSSGDLARYQRSGSSGAGAMLWSSFGAAVPTFVLICYGALLAASNTQIADGLLALPFDTIGRLLPVWYPVPLIAALALSLISGVIVTLYSGGFALSAIGLRLRRPVASIVTGALVAAGAVLLTAMSTDMTMLFRDLATTLAVPVAAWAGIFAADTMIRNRRYHSDSLLRQGGIYPTVNWVNLPAFLVITAIGFGLTTATVAGLDWQGFLWPLLGFAVDSPMAGTDLGVFAALLLGLLVPIASGIPRIRRQESAAPPQN
jgi:purine-cytosine permease-like protein